MSEERATIKCTQCGRTIEECACCNGLDCPPPICHHCLSEALVRSMRPGYVARGASMTWESGQAC